MFKILRAPESFLVLLPFFPSGDGALALFYKIACKLRVISSIIKWFEVSASELRDLCPAFRDDFHAHFVEHDMNMRVAHSLGFKSKHIFEHDAEFFTFFSEHGKEFAGILFHFVNARWFFPILQNNVHIVF